MQSAGRLKVKRVAAPRDERGPFTLCFGVTGLTRARLETAAQSGGLSARTGDQAPVRRLIYPSRPSVFFPSTHLSVGLSLFLQPPPAPFAALSYLTPVILFWAEVCLLVLLSPWLLPSAHSSTTPERVSHILFCQLAVTTELRLHVVNTCIVASRRQYQGRASPDPLLALSIATSHATSVLEPCRTHITNTCTMCIATSTLALPVVPARQFN